MKQTLQPGAMEQQVRAALAAPGSDADLRARLETLAEEITFNGFTWLWGPVLYQRNRVLFRPFILTHFAFTLVKPKFKWEAIRWTGAVAQVLDSWLTEVDRRDDVELFRQLYQWKHLAFAKRDQVWPRVRADLQRRFTAATTRVQREIVLRKFDLRLQLDEATARVLYEADPATAGPYILRHLPMTFWGGTPRTLWTALFARAQAQGDRAFAWDLYRRQAPLKRWADDVLALAQTVQDPAALNAQLEEHHLLSWGDDLGATYATLLERRGRDVFPYVTKHLFGVQRGWFGRGSYTPLAKLARAREWWDFWAALVRSCANHQEYNQAVAELVQNQTLPVSVVQERLGTLTGVAREWNWPGLGLARVTQLEEPVALALYERFPALLRGPYKLHVQISGWGTAYPQLLERLIAAGEEDLVDYFASRLCTRGYLRANLQAEILRVVERLADYYAAMKTDETAFARRAARVLGLVPAFSIFNYDTLVRDNRLARLLFERSVTAYLADANSVRDLVEGSEIHVMALAYRTLALDDDRARALAAENLPLLLGTLFRPLQRYTRGLAFGALANAAISPAHGQLVVQRAREALALPDQHYPKEKLVGLIGQVLHRWPDLRGADEQPVIYGVRP